MSNVGQSQLCRNEISSPCGFSGFFYRYFKGINLLKNRELTFHSLKWTIWCTWTWIWFLGSSLVILWRQLYHKPIRLDSLANPVWPWDGKMCGKEISLLCILIQGEFSTHPLHCTIYSAWQTSCLFSSKTIVKFTRNPISTWNKFRPLGSSAKSNPSRKDKLVFQRYSVTEAHAWSHESAILGAMIVF